MAMIRIAAKSGVRSKFAPFANEGLESFYVALNELFLVPSGTHAITVTTNLTMPT